MSATKTRSNGSRGAGLKLRPAGPITVRGSGRGPLSKTMQATVLFADLRGYTALAERLEPKRIVPLLDEFFSLLARATTLHGGRVFHMAGDGMMAGFGVSEVGRSGAPEALAAGHAMLREFAAVAARWRRDMTVEAGVGVGLHLGAVALSSLGPPGRKQATLVGDTVNVAARLCSRARAGEVLLSCTVADALRTRKPMAATGDKRLVPFLQLPQFELRGRTEPLDIWCIPAAARLAV